jgi:hypothetical protein
MENPPSENGKKPGGQEINTPQFSVLEYVFWGG